MFSLERQDRNKAVGLNRNTFITTFTNKSIDSVQFSSTSIFKGNIAKPHDY